jgi:hypothetical protein
LGMGNTFALLGGAGLALGMAELVGRGRMRLRSA